MVDCNTVTEWLGGGSVTSSVCSSRSKNRNGIILFASRNQWEMNMNPQLRYFLRPAVLAAALSLQLIAAPSFAQDGKKSTATDPPPPDPYAVPTALKGLGFGLGISVSADLSRQSHIREAVQVNNIVRIKDTEDVTVGFVLEAHYFFFQGHFGSIPLAPNLSWDRPWGTGPFVAIEIGGGGTTSNNPVSAYALGWMVGFKEPPYYNATSKKYEQSNLSWNLGLGLRVDPGARVLGDGLVANQPLPPMDQIRYKTSPRYGLMVVSSFGF
jgi:hypothetical protein